MAKSEAERVREYRERKSKSGFKQVNICLDLETANALSMTAKKLGITQGELIKRCISLHSNTPLEDQALHSNEASLHSNVDMRQVCEMKEQVDDEALHSNDDQNNIYYNNNIYTESYISTEGSEVLTPWPMEEVNDKSNEKGTGKGRKGRAKKERPGKAHKFGEETPEYQIAARLISLIASRDPKFMRTKEINPFQWAVSVHPMLAEDGRTLEEVMALLDWIEQNDTWEISTIMGPKKLRDQFTRINIKRQGREARDKQHAEWKAQREQRRFTKAPVPTRRIESADRIRKVNEMVEKARRQRGLDAMPSSIAAALDDCAASMGTGFFEEAGDVFFLSDAAH